MMLQAFHQMASAVQLTELEVTLAGAHGAQVKAERLKRLEQLHHRLTLAIRSGASRDDYAALTAAEAAADAARGVLKAWPVTDHEQFPSPPSGLHPAFHPANLWRK